MAHSKGALFHSDTDCIHFVVTGCTTDIDTTDVTTYIDILYNIRISSCTKLPNSSYRLKYLHSMQDVNNASQSITIHSTNCSEVWKINSK